MKKRVLCLTACLLLALACVGCSDTADKKDDTMSATTEESMSVSAEESMSAVPEQEQAVVEEEPGASEPSNDATEEMNLEEVFQKGMDSFVAKNIEPPLLIQETDIEYLENFYPGIGYANIKQMYIAMAPVTNAPMEVALIEVADSSDVAAIRDIFQERIDARANDTTYPEDSAVWKENGIVTLRGNYIFMAVMTNDYGIPEEFILD